MSSPNNYKIKSVTESELGLAQVSVQIVEKTHIDGNISEKEIEIISKIIKNLKPESVFEIGTFDGRTTLNIARNVSRAAKVYTLDLPKDKLGKTKFDLYKGEDFSEINYVNKEKSGTRYEGKKGSEKIIQLYGDSATFDFAPYFGKMDFVFVDGSHAEKYVINDTEVAFKLIRSGGIILWHDYGVWKDVTKVLDEYYDSGKIRGAVNIVGTCFVMLKP